MKKEAIITVKTIVRAPIEQVWEAWTLPEHIVQWNQASEEWHTPHAENDLRPGGRFLSRMEARDGSQGFDFSGKYNEVRPLEYIHYTLDDGREVNIHFSEKGNSTEIIENFNPEETFPHEMQQQGWQAILNQFKKYAETSFKNQNIQPAKKYLLHGKLTAKKGFQEELTAILLKASQLMAGVRGCRLYAVSRNREDDRAVFVTEIWDSKEDHDHSLTSEEVKNLIMKAIPLLENNPEKGQELELIGGWGTNPTTILNDEQ